MKIMKTERKDLDTVMSVYGAAKKYMHTNGNPHQWADSYPDRKFILSDIDNGASYLILNDDCGLCGVFSFLKGPDESYGKIYDGKWLNDEEYHVIHRLAVSLHNKGAASFAINYCLGRCKNLRVDTHEDNTPMRRLLIKSGFEYCGIIYPQYGGKRLAYQKIGKLNKP